MRILFNYTSLYNVYIDRYTPNNMHIHFILFLRFSVPKICSAVKGILCRKTYAIKKYKQTV